MYKNPHQFAPSLSTLNLWLKTRKSKNENKPSIFETVKFADDAVWATIAIIIEISALVLTIYGAWDQYLINKKILYLIVAIITVFLFVSFDFIGIMFHHHDVPEKVLNNIKIALEKNQIIKTELKKRNKEISWQRFFGMMLLVVSSILKILAIIFFLRGTRGVVIISVLVIFYVIVIYAHAKHTGYWWAALSFKRSLNKEYQEWVDNLPLDDNDETLSLQPSICLFDSGILVKDKNIGRQSITLDSEFNGIYTYKLESIGCFWDENYSALRPFFNDNFNRDLAKAVLNIQYTQLKTPMTH
jgi:hypothetical protein